MNVWWLAIAVQWTSYLELKHRHVVAQGWRRLGSLETLCPLVGAGAEAAFLDAANALEQALGHPPYGIAPGVMWRLLSMRADDLVVGIEGTSVRGICKLQRNGWESYWYHRRGVYEYAQMIDFPVTWVDWDAHVFGAPPVAPAQGVQGVARLVSERQQVIDAWNAYQAALGEE